MDNLADSPGQSCVHLVAVLTPPVGRVLLSLRAEPYFHWVETPNPAAMKPKPTTMFQLPSESMGNEPSVT